MGTTGLQDGWVDDEARGGKKSRAGQKVERNEGAAFLEHRAGRLDDSDTMPYTAGGEAVTGPLNRVA